MCHKIFCVVAGAFLVTESKEQFFAEEGEIEMRSIFGALVVVVLFFSSTAGAGISGDQGFGAILQNSTSGLASSSNMAMVSQNLQAPDYGKSLCANETFVGSQCADTTRNGSALQYLSGNGCQGGLISGGCWTTSLSGGQLLCLDGIQQNTGGVAAQGGVAGQNLIVAGGGAMIAASQMAGFAQFSNVSSGWCSSGSATQSASIGLSQSAVVN